LNKKEKFGEKNMQNAVPEEKENKLSHPFRKVMIF
jgi:hypothetical protein